MSIAFRDDRLVQLLFARGESSELADVRLLLDTIAIVVTIDVAAAETDWGQAAAMTIAACGARMFRGGVFLHHVPAARSRLGAGIGQPLRRTLVALGCRTGGEPPRNAVRVHIGHEGGDQDLHVTASGWTASVSPRADAAELEGSNAITGVMAAAIGISEAFRRLAFGAPDACRVRQTLNAWAPGSATPAGGQITRLPASLWLLGAGNLGQAILFILSLLPFDDRAAVTLYIQDFDRCGPENLATQVLTRHDWLGRRKAEAAASHMAALGFETFAIERKFAERQGPGLDEPRIALIGVDNAEARRAAAKAGFDLVIDAGLGGTPAEILDIEIHAFPGRAEPEAIWPKEVSRDEATPVPERYRRLVEAGVIDACGVTTVAGQPVGVPSTAMVAAALQLAQLCRALATNNYCDAIDLRVARCGDAVVSEHEAALSLAALLPGRP